MAPDQPPRQPLDYHAGRPRGAPRFLEPRLDRIAGIILAGMLLVIAAMYGLGFLRGGL